MAMQKPTCISATGNLQPGVLADRQRRAYVTPLSAAILRTESEHAKIKGSKMEDHETRRKIIRQWMSLPKDKRQTPEQAADFAKKAVEQNELQRARPWSVPVL
jgi:hypothetical protein